ncbi:MAG TPA: hypothetical protein VGW39_13285 [Chthoniobacterales bacterium]|nr:hypothetical protein [Chthoniobacterales bacterium]
MSTCLQNQHDAGDDISDDTLIHGMRQSLKINYPKLFETAKKHWERNFAGKDPSDACVSVRVSSSGSPKRSVPCAGVRRRRGRLLA